MDKIIKTLSFLAITFEENNIPWLLGASGALMVHGVNIVPYDLDIFVSKDDVYKIAELLKDYIKNPVHDYLEGTRNFIECQLWINDMEIEICELGDINFDKLLLLDFNGIKIPVNPLEDELEFYKNRPGKENVVKLIEEKLISNNQQVAPNKFLFHSKI